MIGSNKLGTAFGAVAGGTIILSALSCWQIRTGCYSNLPTANISRSDIDSLKFDPDFPTGHQVVLWLVMAAVPFVAIYAVGISGYFIYYRQKFCECTWPLAFAASNIVTAIAVLFVNIWAATAIQQDCHAGQYAVNIEGWAIEMINDRPLILGLMIAVPCLTLVTMVLTLCLQYKMPRSPKMPLSSVQPGSIQMLDIEA